MAEEQSISIVAATLTAEEASQRATETAKVAAEAVEISRMAQAALVKAENTEQGIKMLSESLRKVFGEYEESRRFIDISRIPLICKNINDMHGNIEEMKHMIEGLDGKFINVDKFQAFKEVITEFKSEVKDGNKWLIRLIIGAVILAGLGLVLVRKI